MAKTNRRLSGVWLDYGDAAPKKLLKNISAAAMAGEFLWTVSDEKRTLECLEPHGDGFRLRKQIKLDDIFPELPGRGDPKPPEMDLESLCIAKGKLWLAGSHCCVRLDNKDETHVSPVIETRDSRCLLGAIPLTRDGGDLAGQGAMLPVQGSKSLRRMLAANPYIEPYLKLPTKENGLDIEGICVLGSRLFLGLRGPVVNNMAIVIELQTTEDGVVQGKPVTHLLNLKGLGVRDMAANGREILVLAGPVSSAHGPFRLYHWRPRVQAKVQIPDEIPPLPDWPQEKEHPEGICLLSRKGKKGLLMIYDGPLPARLDGKRYRADWIALANL